ncbi:MAG: lipocalin family protein [Methylococcales bacterium]|nr:lipocalin family protein [Methylococcales bacterium]
MKKNLILFVLLASGCVSIPDNITPVTSFQIERYLGKWYEIARLDHRFERGLTQISAEYSMRPDGGLKVLNRGYSKEKQEWSEAEGRGYFVQSPNEAYLKVSFFGPFFGSYIVFELDTVNYQYALISGPDKSYFWLLARTPTIDDNLKKKLIAKAAALGFDTKKLIFSE